MMALPVISRAALAAAHPSHLVEPEATPLELMPASKLPLPFSCSTNLANDVTDHLRQAKLTARAWEVCAYLQRQTFGNAGWHRKRGQPETQCAFDLAAWAAAIPCDRSNLRRTLTELVACQIIWLTLDPERPGSGQVGWHLAFADWQPYDQRRQQAKNKQGRSSTVLQKEASMVKSNSVESDHAPSLEGRGHLTTLACSVPALQAADTEPLMPSSQQADMVTYAQDAGEGHECILLFDHARLSKQEGNLTTLACSESAAEAPSHQVLKKKLRKKETETPYVVSEAQSTSLECQLDSVSSEEASKGETSRAADLPTSLPVSTEQTEYWPPRQPHERTDLDYYQRVLREREQQRVALLVRLAHERIGVPLEKASYARIGALAKQGGAALLVKHILLAAANHIDGDPLDYLTRLARGKPRKEAANATRPTAASSYQPYTAEEASALVWNTL